MKTMNKAILTVAAALSVCSMASAQHFDPEHRHSIERFLPAFRRLMPSWVSMLTTCAMRVV